MKKIYICFIFCLIFCSGIFAQNIDSIYTKVHLSNYITSTLSTGIYSFESGRSIYQKRLFKNYYIQEYDTIVIVEKKLLLFRKKEKALFVKNKKITESYLEEIQLNTFEREDTLLRYEDGCVIYKYFWEINPNPIILSCDILNIEIIEKSDNLYLLKLELTKNAANNLKKYSYKYKKSIFGVIINNQIIINFSFNNTNLGYYNEFPTLIELEFKEMDKEKIEYFKSELLK